MSKKDLKRSMDIRREATHPEFRSRPTSDDPALRTEAGGSPVPAYSHPNSIYHTRRRFRGHPADATNSLVIHWSLLPWLIFWSERLSNKPWLAEAHAPRGWGTGARGDVSNLLKTHFSSFLNRLFVKSYDFTEQPSRSLRRMDFHHIRGFTSDLVWCAKTNRSL